MKKIKIVGVPEHFNFPWHLAIGEGAFADRGIAVEWEDIPEGTGRMANMLANEETDLAIILTEGITKSIYEGNPSKIVQIYVESPLLWGIHVDAKSGLTSIEDLKGKTAAISRFGSGSHLMAFINAQNQGWPTEDLDFKVVHNIDNAVVALKNSEADYFMWEHFTTKPLVDSGVFRRLDDCPTPWPCFVVAATDSILKNEPILVNHVLEVINLYTTEFKKIPSINRTLANNYGQQLEDITLWLSKTHWSQEQMKVNQIELVQQRLSQLDLLGEVKSASNFLAEIS